jgi:PAS domain S-box-containing protein
LGLIFVCLAAGIVAAGYFYYRNYEKHYRSEVERQLFAIAELKVGELVQWRKERLGDAGSLFKNAPFAALVRRFFEQPEDVDARRQLQGWIGKIQTSHQYDHVFLLDARGIERLAVPDSSEPVPVHLADNAVKVLHSGQVTFLDFHRDAPDRPIYLGVLVPILDESEASPPLGVLVLRIDPATYLYPLLQRWPTPSLTAETLLVRREGNEVVFLNELRFQKNTALTLRAPLDQKALPAARAALGQEGVMEGIDYRGVPVVAALRVIPDSPWSLVARMDAAEVYAPLRERLWQMVVLIGAVLLGTGAGTGWLWRQQRVRFYREGAETENRTRRMATVVRDSNDAITIQDFEGRITAWNRGAELMYGYGEEEALQMSIGRLTASGKVEEQNDFTRRLLAGEKISSFETQRVTKDGRLLDVWLTVTKLVDDAGKVIGIASTERDITERKREAEKASRMVTVVRDSNDAITIQDFEGRITAWNHGAELMFGYSEQEALKMKIWQLAPTNKAAEQKDFNRRLFAGEKVTSFETQRVTKDGRVLDVWMTVTKLVDDAGNPIGLASTERDITARKRAEEEASRMVTVVRDSNDAITIQDFEGKITAWNRGAELMYGYSEAEALAANIDRLTTPGKVAEQKDFIRRLFAGERVTSFETQRVTKDGRVLDVWMTVTKLVDDAGNPIGLASTERDITARKRAEEEASRMVTVVRDSNDAITIQDFEGKITAWNRGAELMYGYSEAEALAANIDRLTTPGKVAEQKDFIRRLFAGERVTSFETQRLTKDGRLLDVWLTVTKLVDDAGKVIGIASTERDITERKRAVEEVHKLNANLEQRVIDRTAALEAANKELEAFSYSVSHDLRAPLRAMDGFSMALLEDCAGRLDGASQDHLRRIRAGSQRMAELIDDLLNLSQVTRTEMRRERLDLTALAEEIGAELQRAHPDRKVKSVVAPALTADADARMLRIVLNNLLDNAWKFTSKHEQACIEVGAREQDGQRVFFVRDNGAGFDMAYAGRLFGAFQRLHSTQEFEGTGIGLAIVQRIIHRHGGRVWAEGAVGQGATVYFTLGKERD